MTSQFGKGFPSQKTRFQISEKEAIMATALTLSSLGGTFINGTSYNRKVHRRTTLAIPTHTEETLDEESFVNSNDTLRNSFVPLDQFSGDEAMYDAFEEQEEIATLADRLFKTVLTPKQSLAAAEVVADNPELLIELYHGVLDLDDDLSYYLAEELRESGEVASEKGIVIVRNVFKALLTIRTTQQINRSFACHQNQTSGKTILATFARLAQKELRQGRKYGAALPIMRTLGHNDVFASCLG